ncbi:hypothetical protein SDC9_98227 [bioreactor metagenome]|uniref:Uncharacterized protein n=1 Tax=bioreactor metagenome TaxID=1076179 RepID=A0A645AFI5_9ZZZZ
MICPYCGEQVRTESGRCNHCENAIIFAQKLNSFPTLPEIDGALVGMSGIISKIDITEQIPRASTVEQQQTHKKLLQRLRGIFSKRTGDDGIKRASERQN